MYIILDNGYHYYNYVFVLKCIMLKDCKTCKYKGFDRKCIKCKWYKNGLKSFYKVSPIAGVFD